MEKHASAAELKARARGQLLGKYGTLIPALLAVEAILLCLSTLFSALVPGTGPGYSVLGMSIQLILELLLQLAASVFTAGQAYLYLNVACGGFVRVGDVFYGLRSQPQKAIGIQGLILLALLVCYIPTFLFLGLFYVIGNIWLLLPLSLALGGGLAASMVVSLQYSQSYYILLDFPQFSVVQCLKFSRELMKGNKGRRFYLEISFLPLYLLGLLTCCVGLLFVIPYSNAAYTNFYLELMQYRKTHGSQRSA